MDVWTLVSNALVVSMVMAGAGVGLTILPATRDRAVGLMPLILAASTLGVSGYIIVQHGVSVETLWVGRLDSWPGGLALGTALGVALSFGAFWLEALGTRFWYRRHVSRDLSFLYLPVAGRAETMTAVAVLARRKAAFAALSIFSATGEEVFYRGIFLLWGISVLPHELAAVFVLQAVLYGANHLAFGVPAVVGKCLLGMALGAAALVGGVAASLIAHLFYQVLVARQFSGRQEGRT